MVAALFAVALTLAPPVGAQAETRAQAQDRADREAYLRLRRQGEEEAAALETANRLLGRLTGKDAAAMQALTLPEGGATAVSTGKGGKQVVRHFTWAEFFAHLPKDKPIVEEQMRDPLVRVDGDVAMVWGRYEVTVDGKFLHCGTDHFDLVRVDGKWRILNITWNQVKEGCGR